MGVAEHEPSVGPLREPTVAAQLLNLGIWPCHLGWEIALLLGGDRGAWACRAFWIRTHCLSATPLLSSAGGRGGLEATGT